MRVADLIEQLQKMPQGATVRLLVRQVYAHEPCRSISFSFYVPEEQSGEVDDVRHRGPYVLIEGP